MSTQILQIVCVGNSHLASFSKALKTALSEKENISLEFWPIQYMATKWNNFEANDYLASPKFTPDNPAGLQDSDVAIDNESILVLVGLGLSGNHIFTQFGRLAYANPAEMTNGYSCSPLMPYVHGDGINQAAALSYLSERGAPCYSTSLCKKIFTHSISLHLNELRQLSSNSSFKQVYCVPAPNMPEMVARWRLGDHYCDSGCQRIINGIYRQTLEELISNMGVSENIVTHNVGFENDLGFIDDKFANSHFLNDNHVSAHYYEHIINDLLGRMDKLSDRLENRI